ncbi:GDSL esterase/lipase-like protein, partial [Drosera capensis]
MGLPLRPPYKGNPADIAQGVNYASGGGGICPDTSFFQELFSLSARKVALFSLGPVGCNPGQLTVHVAPEGSVCFEDENDAIDMFNKGAKSLVDEFNGNYTGARFTYINYGGIFPKRNTQ